MSESTTTQTSVESIIVDDLLAGSTESYASADKETRATVRTVLTSARDRLLASCDPDAFTFHRALESIKGMSTKITPEVDYTSALADVITSLRIAANRLEVDYSGEGADKIDFDRLLVLTQVTSEPTSEALAAADKIVSSTKIARTRAAGSDIGAALAKINSEVAPETFLTVAEITRLAGLPSGGAVAARLFPASGNCTLDFVTPTPATSDRPRGAVFAGTES